MIGSPGQVARRLPVGREGRILAVGLVMLAAALVWAAVAMPLIGWYQARDQALADRIAYARRVAVMAADLPRAEHEAAVAQLQSAPTRMILDGTTDPIAGAALESLIDGMAHDSQANLVSTEAVPAVQTGGFRRIGLRVTVRAPWANLMQLLAAIEQAEPRMSIGDLQVQSGPIGGSEQLMDMSFSAMAFRAGRAGAADAPPPADIGATP